MKKILVAAAMLFFATAVSAQTHVTQPFHYFFDELTTQVPGVNHFQLKLDGGAPQNVSIPAGGAANGTSTTFSVIASPTLPLGSHSLVVSSCTTTDPVVGCADSLPLAFVLDPSAPLPPTNLRVAP